MKRGTCIVLMIAALALVVLFGCSGPKGPEPIKITVGQGTDPVILDPPMYSDTPTHNVNLLIYDRLYELTKDGRVEPNLAVDLPKIEENGTKYTIKIKDGREVPQREQAHHRRRDLLLPARRLPRKVADEVDLRHDVRHAEGRRVHLLLPHRQVRPEPRLRPAPRTPT